MLIAFGKNHAVRVQVTFNRLKPPRRSGELAVLIAGAVVTGDMKLNAMLRGQQLVQQTGIKVAFVMRDDFR